jgi:hypothetical protein
MLLSKAKTASKVIPTNRNGRDINHTKGKSTSASSANGQQSTNRMHHPMNKIRLFMMSSHQNTRIAQEVSVFFEHAY